MSSWRFRKSNALLLPLIVLALQLGGACIAAQKGPSDIEKYMVSLGFEPIPLSGEAFNFSVEAELGGQRHLLSVSTGSEISNLDSSTASKLKKLGQLGVTLEDEVLGRVSDPTMLVMDKLTLAGAQFIDQPVRSGFIKRGSGHVTLEGTLGCDFLIRNRALLDCAEQRLYVRSIKPGTNVLSALEATLRQSGFSEVPIEFNRWLSVVVTINGQPVQMKVCTGCALSCLDRVESKRVRLTAIRASRAPTGSQIVPDAGIRGKLAFCTARSLEIGSCRTADFMFVVTDLKPVASELGYGENVRGWIGADVLILKGALLDCCTRRLWFRPTKTK